MPKPILTHFPMPIRTARLLLRPPMPGDGAELNASIHETFESLNRWMPWADEKPSVEDSEENILRAHSQWILKEDFRILLFDPSGKTLIGSSGLHRVRWRVPSFEIGYWVRKKFEGQGFITESTVALTQYAFRALGAKRVEIRCDAQNHKSQNIPVKLGFDLEGEMRNHDRDSQGELRDTLIYSRIDEKGLPELKVTWGETQ